MQPSLIVRSVLIGLVAVACGAGCGGAPVAASGSPSAALASAAATPAATILGPTALADWTARQGFGGSSGLHNVAKLGVWLTQNTSDATKFDVDSDAHDIQSLIDWLDAHPATACWVSYHAAIRAALASLLPHYATASAAIAAGKFVPYDEATAIAKEAQAAYAMPTPANCP